MAAVLTSEAESEPLNMAYLTFLRSKPIAMLTGSLPALSLCPALNAKAKSKSLAPGIIRRNMPLLLHSQEGLPLVPPMSPFTGNLSTPSFKVP